MEGKREGGEGEIGEEERRDKERACNAPSLRCHRQHGKGATRPAVLGKQGGAGVNGFGSAVGSRQSVKQPGTERTMGHLPE